MRNGFYSLTYLKSPSTLPQQYLLTHNCNKTLFFNQNILGNPTQYVLFYIHFLSLCPGTKKASKTMTGAIRKNSKNSRIYLNALIDKASCLVLLYQSFFLFSPDFLITSWSPWRVIIWTICMTICTVWVTIRMTICTIW